MGAYDGNPRGEIAYSRDSRSQWSNSSSQFDGGIANLVDRFSELGVGGNDPSKENLFQVMKAVEAAENTIKNQMEENNYLRTELQRKMQELEKYKSDALTTLRPTSDPVKDEQIFRQYEARPLVGNEEDGVRSTDSNSSMHPHGTLVIHQNKQPKNEDFGLQTQAESQLYSDNSKVNGTLKRFPGGQAGLDNVGFSQLSTPSSRSISPSRYQMEGEYDPKFGSLGHGLVQMPDQNNHWKQDLLLKVREREEEIALLRKHLADYSVKEAQIRNEKYVLEKRIAHMRMAFDQQQQELVEAASKALSYRQEIIEENIRLTYALQGGKWEG